MMMQHSRFPILWALVILGSFSHCDKDYKTSNGSDDPFQELIETITTSDASVPGVILRVTSNTIDFAGVTGYFEHDGDALEFDDIFRGASITKTLTSAALFVLAEEGDIDLEDTIDNHLSATSIAALSSGGYDPSAITIAQLLNHTAGIYDYTEADEYYNAIYDDPSHNWTRAEQLNYAMTSSGSGQLNEPGEEFRYGDTHYILAGEIIELTTGQDLNEAFRSLLKFDELGIDSSWMESIGTAPYTNYSDDISHPYIGDLDTRSWHASWDLWGGGGLATTADDMISFMKALFTIGSNGIFQEQATLDSMLTVVAVAEGEFFGMNGGYGIGHFIYDGIGDCYAGFGFFTTIMVHCPNGNIFYAGTENQAEPKDESALLEGVLEILVE